LCFEFADAGPRGLELVLQRHDPGGSVECHAFVEQLPHPGGEHQLAAGVAAVPTAGALGLEDSCGVEAAQERWLDVEEFGGLAHGERGVVLVVKSVHTHWPPDPFFSCGQPLRVNDVVRGPGLIGRTPRRRTGYG
jgi:hypothetical protein